MPTLPFSGPPLTLPQICGGITLLLGLVIAIVGLVVIPGMVSTGLNLVLVKAQEGTKYACKEDDAGWKAFEAIEEDYYAFTMNDEGKSEVVPAYDDYYLYDMVNPTEVLLGQEIPKFVEVGPFVFRSWTTSSDMSFVDIPTGKAGKVREGASGHSKTWTHEHSDMDT